MRNAFLSLLAVGVLATIPTTSFADRKVTVHRDLDGDGHFNKKTYRVPSRHYHGGHGYYGGSHHYRRPYGYGYYGRPYYYGGPSVGFSYSRYSQPSYYSSTSVYRGAPVSNYSDDLAVDVQRELQRRGYYSGPIDGDIGPGSRSAIRAYQADRGLAVTGRVDSRLIRSLGIG
jgi:hypothetical protein